MLTPWTSRRTRAPRTGDPDPVVQTDDPTEEVLPVSACLCEPGPASIDGTWANSSGSSAVRELAESFAVPAEDDLKSKEF
jgi:hypothetical protein